METQDTQDSYLLKNKRKTETNFGDSSSSKQSQDTEVRSEYVGKKSKIFSECADYDSFERLFVEYMNDVRWYKRTSLIKDSYLDVKALIWEMTNFVIKNGGFSEVIAHSRIHAEVEKGQAELFKNYSFARNILDKYVFHFIKYLEEKSKKSPDIEKAINLYPEYVEEIPSIRTRKDAKKEDIESCMIASFDYDLVMVKSLVNKLDLDKEYFTIDYLEKNYPEMDVDVVEQNPHFNGFSFNWHTKKNWKMKDYIKYVGFEANKEKVVHIKTDKKSYNKFQKAMHILKDYVYYCVNVDLDDYPELKEDLANNLPQSILFRGQNDLLSYLRTNIRGMTSPQIYIKVSGTWTGGHEENNRFRSINMNHGPGASIWYGVRMKDSMAFRELVKNQYGMDIYRKEGIWFPNLDWFMTNKIPVLYGLQEKYDIAMVGVGCLHWVRAKGHSINSSWNFGTKDVLQIKSSYERDTINKQIQFNSLVKLNTVILDFLNMEMNHISDEIFEFCSKQIREAISQSYQDLDKINSHFSGLKIYKEPHAYLIINCEECKFEVFNYWGFCHYCNSSTQQEAQMILCPDCFIKHDKECEHKENFYLFYKYTDFTLETFLARLDKRSRKEEFIDLPQVEIGKYSIEGKEIAQGNLLKGNYSKKEIKTLEDFMGSVKAYHSSMTTMNIK